jgi:hypothetical protein
MSVPGSLVPEAAKQDDSTGSLWQWLAIGILLGCWLAEAAWCIEMA